MSCYIWQLDKLCSSKALMHSIILLLIMHSTNMFALWENTRNLFLNLSVLYSSIIRPNNPLKYITSENRLIVYIWRLHLKRLTIRINRRVHSIQLGIEEQRNREELKRPPFPLNKRMTPSSLLAKKESLSALSLSTKES